MGESSLKDGKYRQFARAVAQFAVDPDWDTIALVDPSGHELLNSQRPFGEPLAVSVAGSEAFQRAVRTSARVFRVHIVTAARRTSYAAVCTGPPNQHDTRGALRDIVDISLAPLSSFVPGRA